MKFPDRELKVGNSSALFCFKKEAGQELTVLRTTFSAAQCLSTLLKMLEITGVSQSFFGGCQFRHTDTCNEISPSIW